MKKNSLAIIAFLVFFILCTSCSTSDEPKIVIGTEVYTVTSEGAEYNRGVSISFDGVEADYTMDSISAANLSFHQCTECQDCGYKEENGEKYFHICDASSGYKGMTINLTKPIQANLITGMDITLMTGKEASSSEIRIMNRTSTEGTILSNCASLSGSSEDWKTVNLGIDDINTLAEEDGYIHGFKIFARDKDHTYFKIQSITLRITVDRLWNVDLTGINCMSEKDAVKAVANGIKENFEQAGIAATIEVEAMEFLSNSSAGDGYIMYRVDADLYDDKIYVSSNKKAVLQGVRDSWLPEDNSPFGATQTINGSWEGTFTNGGKVTFKSGKLSCTEGLQTMEYTIIPADADYTDENIEWHSPQLLKSSKKGYKKIHIDPYLDYGDSLMPGEQYRFVLRGVTKNNNYILHAQKEFEYFPDSEEGLESIINSFDIIQKSAVYLSKEDNNSKQLVYELTNLLSDTKVKVMAELIATGASSNRYKINLGYGSEYTGKAFTTEYTVWNDQEATAVNILPVSPYDGETNIILATETVIQYSNAPFDAILETSYPYKPLERCTPPPVTLMWIIGERQGNKVFSVKLSESSDMSSPKIYQTEDYSLDIYNLKAGTQYYWCVESGEDTSPIFTFKTAEGYPRFIKADGVMNIRDMGGYVTIDGKKIVKQGLVYRSANLDGATAEGKNILISDLGIVTDLDFRGEGTSSPLGKDIKYYCPAIKWYAGVFDQEQYPIMKEAFDIMADPSNYPMVYHCAIGRDRTGTMSMLLLGLLGVDRDVAIRDYFASFNSEMGGFNVEEMNALKINIDGFMNGLAEYAKEGATYQEQVIGYLKTIGVTDEQIATIQDLLLEDYVAPKTESAEKNLVTIILIIVCIAVVVLATIGTVLVLKIKKKHIKSNGLEE